MSWSLIICQITRVISSPSSSTTGLATLTLPMPPSQTVCGGTAADRGSELTGRYHAVIAPPQADARGRRRLTLRARGGAVEAGARGAVGPVPSACPGCVPIDADGAASDPPVRPQGREPIQPAFPGAH